MRRRLRPIAAALTAAAALASPARAEAVEHEWHVGGSFGYASLFGGPTSWGFGGGGHVTYGITDAWNVMGALDVTAHPYGQWVIVSSGVGVGYVLDVLRWVPYAGALAGGAGVFSSDPLCGLSISEPCRAFRINLEIPFGLDYRINRKLTVGLAGRFQLLLLGERPWMTMGAYAKAEYTWGH